MKSDSKLLVMILAVAGIFFMNVRPALSHCQIPCGIYDDELRFQTISEHINTIEKAMKQITELETALEKNYNQIVRWVNSKDQHADEIANIVSYYFLAQRVTPYKGEDPEASHDYGTKLELLHEIIFNAMKSKQTTDLQYVQKLRTLLEEFHSAYFGEQHDQ